MNTAKRLGKNHKEAYDYVAESVNNLERTINAALFTMYPERSDFANEANTALELLGADAVEVNAMLKNKQITLVVQPGGVTSIEMRDSDSICVLTVGSGESQHVSDAGEDDFYDGHLARTKWSAWCSSPVKVNGFSIGAMCALETEPRDWTDSDVRVVERGAGIIGQIVEDWVRKSCSS